MKNRLMTSVLRVMGLLIVTVSLVYGQSVETRHAGIIMCECSRADIAANAKSTAEGYLERNKAHLSAGALIVVGGNDGSTSTWEVITISNNQKEVNFYSHSPPTNSPSGGNSGASGGGGDANPGGGGFAGGYGWGCSTCTIGSPGGGPRGSVTIGPIGGGGGGGGPGGSGDDHKRRLPTWGN